MTQETVTGDIDTAIQASDNDAYNLYEEIDQKAATQPAVQDENEYATVDIDVLQNFDRSDSHLYTLKKTKKPAARSAEGDGFFVGDSFYASMKSSSTMSGDEDPSMSFKSKDSDISGGFIGNSFYASMRSSVSQQSPMSSVRGNNSMTHGLKNEEGSFSGSMKSTPGSPLNKTLQDGHFIGDSFYSSMKSSPASSVKHHPSTDWNPIGYNDHYASMRSVSSEEPEISASYKNKRLSMIDEKYTEVTPKDKRSQSSDLKYLSKQPDSTSADNNYTSVYSTSSKKSSDASSKDQVTSDNTEYMEVTILAPTARYENTAPLSLKNEESVYESMEEQPHQNDDAEDEYQTLSVNAASEETQPSTEEYGQLQFH